MSLEDIEQDRMGYYRTYPVLEGVKGLCFLGGSIILVSSQKLPREFWLLISEQLPLVRFIGSWKRGLYQANGKCQSYKKIRRQSLAPIFSLRACLKTLPEAAVCDHLETVSDAHSLSLNSLFDEVAVL